MVLTRWYRGRSALGILDGRGWPVVAAVGFGVPAALVVLELDRRRGAGNLLLGGGALRRLQGGRVRRKGLREHAVGLVGPSAVVLDDLIRDFRHGSLCGLELRLRDAQHVMAICARAMRAARR